MRIIAGEWRGRRIQAPAGKSVRPTLDRVREAWMSILHPNIPGARVLDLFCGSGALGIEALSRGAESATFVDREPRSLAFVSQNLTALDAVDRATVTRADAVKFAAQLRADEFDLAFADPPYDTDAAGALAEIWLATPFAMVLSVEHDSHASMPAGGETRRYGGSSVTFYR